MVDHGSVTNSSQSSHEGFPELKGRLLSLIVLVTLLEDSMACNLLIVMHKNSRIILWITKQTMEMRSRMYGMKRSRRLSVL
jgi:hypothetical protein